MAPKVLLFLGFCLLALSSCVTTTSGGGSSTAATWQRAQIFIPNENTTNGKGCVGDFAAPYIQDCLARIQPGRQFTVILFMHGCAGMVPDNIELAEDYRSLGYAVIAPNSFARAGRQRECVSSRRKVATISLRKAEIDYALTQIPSLGWVDPARIVLAGQSEGANTVSEVDRDDVFAGYIITGWDCRFGLAPDGPVLAVKGALDDTANRGTCSANGAPHSASVIVPGAGHSVANRPAALEAFERFLNAVAPKG